MATSQDTSYGDTLFQLSTNGTGFQVLRRFAVSDGMWPYDSLIRDGEIFYGMNTYGGSSSGWAGNGTIFRINTDGSGFQVLHRFAGGDDGRGPHGNLLQSGTTLYGMTSDGGSQNKGVIFAMDLPTAVSAQPRLVPGQYPAIQAAIDAAQARAGIPSWSGWTRRDRLSPRCLKTLHKKGNGNEN